MISRLSPETIAERTMFALERIAFELGKLNECLAEKREEIVRDRVSQQEKTSFWIYDET